jgi:glycosyltransferase involved in cell wall biosynthesis
MKAVILEPYLTGSHAAWAGEYAGRSSHEIVIIGLEGRYWKWRMHGGAITLAHLFTGRSLQPDLIIASDMLDLTTFLALTRRHTSGIRTAMYFHENQLSYPWSETDRDRAQGRDLHYAFINFASAVAADAVFFNSEHHRTSFLGELVPFLRGIPDYNEERMIDVIREKSRVLHLGLDLHRFDRYAAGREPDRRALLLWNHRWEYDKNPDDFFRALFVLQDEGLEFEVAVMGQRFGDEPPIFKEAASRLGGRIVQFGFVEDFASYANWLWRADIVPVTSIQDFFGASVVQAMYCDCCPVLPRRLAYPEHIPAGRREEFLYETFDGLVEMLRRRILDVDETRRTRTRGFVETYDWETMAPIYDRTLFP